MNLFVLNLLLAIVWSALNEDSSLDALFTGFVLGFAILWITRPLLGGGGGYFKRCIAWLRLVVLFTNELFWSCVTVAHDVMRARTAARPAIIELPLDVKTDAGILMLTNLITLTPGTLTLDVSKDRKTAYIHAMFCDDAEAEIAGIKNGMERWVIDAIEAEE